MFLGLRTVIYKVDDMNKARSWFERVLGIAPYFDEPFYIGFSPGGYELGLTFAPWQYSDRLYSNLGYNTGLFQLTARAKF